MASWASLSSSILVASAELDSLADDANIAGSVVAASGYTYGDWILRVANRAASVGKYMELYLVTQMNGSPAYGGAATDPAPNLSVGTFVVDSTATDQLIMKNFTLVPNRTFTPVIINKTGSALGASNNFLYFQPYNED